TSVFRSSGAIARLAIALLGIATLAVSRFGGSRLAASCFGIAVNLRMTVSAATFTLALAAPLSLASLTATLTAWCSVTPLSFASRLAASLRGALGGRRGLGKVFSGFKTRQLDAIDWLLQQPFDVAQHPVLFGADQ